MVRGCIRHAGKDAPAGSGSRRTNLGVACRCRCEGGWRRTEKAVSDPRAG
jgi:hypothetical protein